MAADLTRDGYPNGYVADTWTSSGTKVAKLNGSGHKVGPAVLLKVMAGDIVNMRAYSWYTTPSQTFGQPVSPLQDLLSLLNTSVSSVSGGKATVADLASGGNLLSGPIGTFLSGQPTPASTPKAYMAWVLLDEQFKLVQNGPSGSYPVGGPGSTPHQANGVAMPKSGYLYVYLANETPGQDVFFDNLQVDHIRGPIVEETHYYPFGLVMKAISYRSANVFLNKEKTFQGQQFDDEMELNWIQFKWRNHDVQIGRFVEIDPLSEEYTYNSTYAFSENKVTSHVELEGLEAVSAGKPEGYLFEAFRQIFEAGSSLFSIKAEAHINHLSEIKTEVNLPGIKTESKTTVTTAENKIEFLSNFQSYFANKGGNLVEVNYGTDALSKVEMSNSVTLNTPSAPIKAASKRALDSKGESNTIAIGTEASVPIGQKGKVTLGVNGFTTTNQNKNGEVLVTSGFKASIDATYQTKPSFIVNSPILKITKSTQTNIGASFEWGFKLPW